MISASRWCMCLHSTACVPLGDKDSDRPTFLLVIWEDKTDGSFIVGQVSREVLSVKQGVTGMRIRRALGLSLLPLSHDPSRLPDGKPITVLRRKTKS